MKHLSALEVFYLARELHKMAGAKLQQVYHPAKKQLFLQFHMRGRGNAVLKVSLPNACYIVSSRNPASSVSGFCSFLRKKLNNCVLKTVSQPGFERILRFDFSSKNDSFSLFFELFSRGNSILTCNGRILAVEERQSWRSRQISVNQEYRLPPAVSDPRNLDGKRLANMLKTTNKADAVRFFALELSLGGLYAEELCILSGIDKKKAPASLGPAELAAVISGLKRLFNAAPSPSVICENDKAIDAVPIDLRFYKKNAREKFASFSKVLESLFSRTSGKPDPNHAAVSRLKKIMEEQQETIAAARDSLDRNSRAAELIYEHYQEVKELLASVNAVRKRDGWDAVKKVAKSGRKIISVDGKTGKIAVDLQ